ncbi:hypothetical protein [Paludisphaera mucosa]|uniref:SHOCT domain-containing protein n=1 Tax=Paludisphaera mucosa TaxID=3030827 RepID=A0ABT6F5X9_9BACT|nr:hypothetical protein [Paludisphaera mucosa]MDG3002906.1 hypothetical protein [Paludisphaera mucosa]
MSCWTFDLTGGLGPLALVSVSPMYYYLGLAALVAAMIWSGIVAYRSWEEAHEEFDPATKEELLDAFRQARIEGELNEEEYAKIRMRLEQDE